MAAKGGCIEPEHKLQAAIGFMNVAVFVEQGEPNGLGLEIIPQDVALGFGRAVVGRPGRTGGCK